MITLLATVQLAARGVTKLVQMHQAGVDREIVDEIHNTYRRVHALITKHHNTHILGNDDADGDEDET